jgi:peptidoglycan/xylan/chitin deacetylase (PgdA/CDA1 family)
MSLRKLAARVFAATPFPEHVLRYRARGFVTILGYHRILPRPRGDYSFNENVFSATPEEFSRELKYLRANLDIISISELMRGLENPSLLPRRPAVITLDDGYCDNYTYAFPLLRETKLAACFFVCTNLIDTRLIPWHEAWVCCLKRSRVRQIHSPFCADDPPYVLDEGNRAAAIRRFRRQMRRVPWSQMPTYLDKLRRATAVDPADYLSDSLFMSWDALREMAAAGMDIGGHTRNHPILSRVTDGHVLEGEIGGCYQDLARELNQSPLAFAYPFGQTEHMSDRADEEIERAGFKLSFSFMHGFSPCFAQRPFRLPRVHASFGEDFQAFRLGMATAPSPDRPIDTAGRFDEAPLF